MANTGRTFAATDSITFGHGRVDLSGAWTLALTFKLTTLAGTQSILASSTNAHFDVYTDSNQLVLSLTGSGDSYAGPSATPAAGQWCTVFISKAVGTTRPLFHRGRVHADGSLAVAHTAQTDSWILGFTPVYSVGFGGDVGGVYWWNRVLTDHECEAAYNHASIMALSPVSAVKLDGAVATTITDLVAGGTMSQSAISGTTAGTTEPLPGYFADPATVRFRAHEAADLREWALIQAPTAQTTPVADTSIVKAGTQSTRVELLSGQRLADGVTARNELGDARRIGVGDERYYAWSTQLDAGITLTAGKWGVITQWRDALIADDSNPFSPSLELDVADDGGTGVISLSSYGSGGPETGDSLLIWTTPATRSVWHNFVVRVLHEPDMTGFIEVWYSTGTNPLVKQTLANSTQRMSARTIQSAAYIYFKQGIYRDPTYARDWRLWHDALVISSNPADVGVTTAGKLLAMVG